MSALEYDIFLRKLPEDEGGGFLAIAPDLTGCIADGDTREEALRNIEDAMIEWQHAQEVAGREMPKPGTFKEQAMDEQQEVIDLIENQESTILRLRLKVRQLEALREHSDPTLVGRTEIPLSVRKRKWDTIAH